MVPSGIVLWLRLLAIGEEPFLVGGGSETPI